MPKLPLTDPKQLQAMRALEEAMQRQRMGQTEEADQLYARIVKKHPSYFDGLHLYGLFQFQRGKPGEALKLLTKATALNPRSAAALNLLGVVLVTLGRERDSLSAFDRALAVRPDDPNANHNRGRLLFQLGRYEEALPNYDRALAAAPSSADIHTDRGAALHALNRNEDALASFDRALALNPRGIEALNNRSSALQELGRHDEALECSGRALQIDPNNAEAHNNAGVTLQFVGRPHDALTRYARALAIDPGHANARWNQSTLNLSLGRFEQGWPDFETRWTAMKELRMRGYRQPRWNGARVAGTLLVWSDGGLGDEILFAGMTPELQASADALVLEVEPRLVSLFARAFPTTHVVARSKALYPGRIDVQEPLTSVGRFLRPSWDSFPPREQGYLSADPERTRSLRQRLAGDGKLVIGLSWHSINPKLGASKSLTLRDYEPLLRLPNCRFVDLQYGDTTDERDALERDTGLQVERLPDIDNTQDIEGLAALISACDLVITISNTTAHLAGALGRPAWVLISRGNSRLWYWFSERDDSPWYPSVRLFRQPVLNDWRAVLDRVKNELETMARLPRTETRDKRW